MKRVLSSLRLLSLLVLGGTLFLMPFPAHAQFSILGDIAAAVVGQLTSAFAYVVGYIGGIILNVLGWIVNIMMELNEQVFDPQNTLLHIGWGIMRDVANLGFVLVIIVIAIAMMLRVERYGSQKLLVRLIAAAIIVNFSLAIAGIFLEFANTFTQFFLNRIPSPAGIGSALMGAFNPQRFQDPENFNANLEGLSTFGAEMFAWIAQTVFPVVFIFIAIVTVGTFAIMLFLRYLHLTFLGIMAPIIWLFWVVPDLSSKFNQWWSSFIKWVFFAPASTFFIYLAFAALENLGKLPALTAGGSNFFTAGLITIMSQGVQMFVISGIMLGGLIMAQQMSITGANIGLSLANKAKAGVFAAAGRAGRRVGARVLESKPMAGLAGFLQGQTGFRGLGVRLGGQADIVRRGLVEDADKRLKKYGDAHLARNLDALSQPERVAAMERLAKNGTVGLIKDRSGSPDVLSNITEANRKLFDRYYGPNAKQWKSFEVAAGMNVASANLVRSKDVVKNPNDKREYNEEMAKWIKGLKADEISKLPVGDYFGKETIEQLGPKATKQLSDSVREALVRGIAVNVPADVAKLAKGVKGEGFERLNATIDKVGEQLVAERNIKAANELQKVQNQIPAVRLYAEIGGTPQAPASTPSTTPPPATPKAP